MESLMVFRKARTLLPFLTGLLAAAGVPHTDMGITTLGVEYQGGLTVQALTAPETVSEVRAFNFLLRYTPVPWLLVSAGAGGAQFALTTDTFKVNSPSISAAGAIDFYSPPVLKFLSFTAGGSFLVFNSAVEKDSAYTPAFLITPSTGIRFSISGIGGIESGVRGYLLQALQEIEPLTTAYPVRGYLTLHLHRPKKPGYVSFSIDASPKTSIGTSDDLEELSLSLQIGLLIRPKKKLTGKNTGEQHPDDYFKQYDTMSRELDTMATELQRKRTKKR